MFKGLLSTCLGLVLISPGAFASKSEKELDGFYVPIRGWTETRDISRPSIGEPSTEIGKYKITLRRERWSKLPREDKMRIKRRLVIKGVMRGVLDPVTFTFSHVFVPEDRDGTLYTADDIFIPEAGDPFCSLGVPLSGAAIINFRFGTGDYSNLTNGTIHARGTFNNCSEDPNYLNSDFEVDKGVGGLCFGNCLLPEEL